MAKYRSNSPLPYLEGEARKAEERTALDANPNHRKFSARDMLKRIALHKAGEPVTLRDGDEHFHDILEDSGLIGLSKEGEQITVTRTDSQSPAKPIETLTFRMEQIHEIRLKLMAQKPTKKSD